MMTAMADIDRLGEMQLDVLKRIGVAIEENLQDLEIARKSGRLATIAWLTRNLLELGVWTAFCANSEENAKQFVLDSARDLHDALDIPDGIFSDEFSFRAARCESLASAEKDGFETLDDRYSAVSKIARALGKGDEFKYFNKLLSKFAHPTALTVIYQEGHSIEALKAKFYGVGSSLGEGALKLIQAKLAN